MAKIWMFNETISLVTGSETQESQFNINFTSNNQSFVGFYLIRHSNVHNLRYLIDVNDSLSSTIVYMDDRKWEDLNHADTSAYRTITFGTAPTGELLTWLQANAVSQGGTSTTTVLLLNINVIKAGSSITVEAVNASTMGYITGTVGTITDTVTQLI